MVAGAARGSHGLLSRGSARGVRLRIALSLLPRELVHLGAQVGHALLERSTRLGELADGLDEPAIDLRLLAREDVDVSVLKVAEELAPEPSFAAPQPTGADVD